LTANAGPPLGLNTNLHAVRPSNFLRVVLDGIDGSSHGTMPAFRGVLDDRQIADLARYARSRFAPEKPAWEGLEESVARLRGRPPS
jgi:nicotinate dehydrogenase subunit B